MFRDLAAVDSDPDTVKSTRDRNGSHTAWYIRHYGEYASMRECDGTVTPDEYRAFNDLLGSYFGFEGEYGDDGDLCEWDNVTDLLIAYSYRHDDGSIGVDWRLADLSNV